MSLDQWTPATVAAEQAARGRGFRGVARIIQTPQDYDDGLRASIATVAGTPERLRMAAWVNGSLARGYGHWGDRANPYIRSREGKLDPWYAYGPLFRCCANVQTGGGTDRTAGQVAPHHHTSGP